MASGQGCDCHESSAKGASYLIAHEDADRLRQEAPLRWPFIGNRSENRVGLQSRRYECEKKDERHEAGPDSGSHGTESRTDAAADPSRAGSAAIWSVTCTTPMKMALRPKRKAIPVRSKLGDATARTSSKAATANSSNKKAASGLLDEAEIGRWGLLLQYGRSFEWTALKQGNVR
jgi:hypothetical protein